MNEAKQNQDERGFEQLMGNLLRWGVTAAGVIVFLGGIIYLFKHGVSAPNYGTFHGVPDQLRTVAGIVTDFINFHGRTIIQFGLLVLILTPVMRVLFSIFGFIRERDWVYVFVTTFVLAVLVFGLVGGHL